VEEPVTLITIGNGALLELFDRELARVVADVLDPNTQATTTRKIRIDVQIKPNEDRNESLVAYSVSATLGKAKSFGSKFYFGRINGVPMAVEGDKRQKSLFDKPRPATVAHINTETGEMKEGIQ
jgi:hypothetical protein